MRVFPDKLKFALLSSLAITLATSCAIGLVTVDKPQEPTGKIYLPDGRAEGRLLAFDPATADHLEVFAGCDIRPRISPDGRAVAYTRDGSVWVRDLKDGTPRQILDLDGAAFGTPLVWSPDGSQLVVSLGRRDEERDHWRFTTFRVNADGSGKTELKIPPEDGVNDWSSDGRWLLTTSSRGAKIGWQLYVMRPNGTDQRQITEGGNPFYTRFSPDGRSVLYSDGTTEERRGIWVVDLEGLARRRVLPDRKGGSLGLLVARREADCRRCIRERSCGGQPRRRPPHLDGPRRQQQHRAPAA